MMMNQWMGWCFPLQVAIAEGRLYATWLRKVRPPNLEVAETPSANAVGGAAKQLIV